MKLVRWFRWLVSMPSVGRFYARNANGELYFDTEGFRAAREAWKQKEPLT